MKKLVRMLFLGSFVWMAAGFFQSAQAQAKTTQGTSEEPVSTIQSLLDFAERHLHIPYRSGGTTQKGFDCSGFVRYCFSKWNISLPHSSSAQAKEGKKIDLSEARPGDLIFFKGSSVKSNQVGHVGIITEVTPNYVRFIHSAFQGGIRYDLLSADYYRRRFVAIRRVLQSDESDE